MSLLYNGILISEQELRLPLHNRAFQYNDGFFETIVVQQCKLRFWPDHVARMQEAAQTLRLQLPAEFASSEFADKLLKLAEQNGAINYGRLKLKVWRSGAGLYTPEENSTDWLATVHAQAPAAVKPLHIGICSSTFTNYSPLSYFKGPNALLYVLAGIEKKDQQADDMLLLNRQGIVSELISSNIFWINNDIIYTPALDTGCVNGIVRRNIVRWCQAQSIKLKEVYFKPERLFKAEAVFASNVTGIKYISSINKSSFAASHPILDKLKEDLFL